MNKKSIWITIVLIIISLGLGFGSCYLVFKGNVSNNKCKKVNVQNIEEERKCGDNDSLIYDDNFYYEKISNGDISLKNEEDILDFINTTNSYGVTSSLIVGALLLNQNIDLFKSTYAMKSVLGEEWIDIEGTFEISKETLEKLISQVFVNNKLDSNFFLESIYNGFTMSYGCGEWTCLIDHSRTGGVSPYSTYVTKIEKTSSGDNKVYTVDFVYLEVVEDKSSEDGYYYNILNKKDGRVIKEKILLKDNYKSEDVFSYVKDFEYSRSEITFNAKNQYVSTKVIK